MTSLRKYAFAFAIATQITTAASLLPLAAQADDLDLGALTCKQVMQLSGGERDAPIAFLQGFLAGKTGSMKVDQEMLAIATDKLIDACLDAPTAIAVTTLQASLAK